MNINIFKEIGGNANKKNQILLTTKPQGGHYIMMWEHLQR